MVATNRQQRGAIFRELECVSFDRGYGCIDVEWVECHISGIGDLCLAERCGTGCRVIWSQQTGGLSHMIGAESRPGPVRDAASKWGADDFDVSRTAMLFQLGETRQQPKRGIATVSRHPG